MLKEIGDTRKITLRQCGKSTKQQTGGFFVICTGKQYSIKDFINLVSKELKLKINWKGKGLNEKGYDNSNKCIIECNKKYLRPAEVDTLRGNCSKARKILKWRPKHNIKSLIKDMISYELKYLND